MPLQLKLASQNHLVKHPRPLMMTLGTKIQWCPLFKPSRTHSSSSSRWTKDYWSSQTSMKEVHVSHREVDPTVWVKHQTPRPQNFILGGPSKSRVSCDSLSIFQWISGFCNIVKEESDLKTKNQMLEYICDLMDDAQDFGWNSGKASHAVLLCCMEEGKVTWQETTKIDRTHAQRQTTNQSNGSNPTKKHSESNNPCKYLPTEI